MEAENASNHESSYPVVGIGASAGGLDALEEFFSAMPQKTGAAFVVIQHLSPNHKSLMEEILARHTEIPIQRATDGMVVEPNHIYLNSPRRVLLIEDGKFQLSGVKATTKDAALHLPIDDFFTSLAASAGKKAVGVILSGTGRDGANGILKIRAAKGLVISQEPDGAGFKGMPNAAIESGVVDITTEPACMPELLDLHFQGKDAAEYSNKRERSSKSISSTSLEKLFGQLKDSYGIDFAQYRPTTIDRRIDRRILLNRCDSLDDYLVFLSDHPGEVDSLYKDLLIGVTQFFRDTEAFQTLEKEVIPEIFRQANKADKAIRIWSAGCANGAEAYSIAILFDEYRRRNPNSANFKVFATDVHPASIAKASEGRFDGAIVDQISQSRLETYFDAVGKGYRVRKELRQNLLFAVHNVMSDPPFTNLDLVVCRNMLIYFEPEIQRRVISFFNYGLRQGGFLFLGHSESLADQDESFEALSEEWRLFKSLHRRTLLGSAPKVSPRARKALSATPRHVNKESRRVSQEDTKIIWAYEALLDHYAERGFLVNDRREVLHVFGDADSWLRPRVGRVSNKLENLLPEDASSLVSAAIHRANRDDVPVSYKRITIGGEWGSLLVTPLTHPASGRRHFLVAIERVKEDYDAHTVEFGIDGPADLASLQSELDSTKEHLQAANEELETSNEELQATNQELMAANEELQSTNEELQSTNEELQSTNEELHSVNSELQSINSDYNVKLRELTQVTADLQNMLNSTDMGVVFIDSQLRIKKFTPAANLALRLSPKDIGSPVSELSHQLDLGDLSLSELAIRATTQGTVTSVDVEMPGKMWVSIRVLPYMVAGGRIEGAVLTILDATQRIRAESDRASYTAKLEASSKSLQDFAYMASHDLGAPLRYIRSFAKLLLDEATGLSAEQETYLEHIGNGVKKAEDLVEGLIKFSRVETRATAFVACDANDAVERALAMLRSLIKAKDATIQRSLLPTVLADPSQLTQLLQSLVANALVFCERSPEVKISAEHRGDEWLFSVSDNGIGLDEKDFERVFLIFKKLHSDATYSGNGIGLAICKRIVERHGGRIWFESKLGVGSTVNFTLPFDGGGAEDS